MSKRIVRAKIKDIQWTFKLMADRQFNSLHSEGDYRAITIPDSLEIHFRKSDFSLTVLRHELLHAYVHTCLISDNPEKEIDKEEICAKIWEMHLDQALILSNNIYKEFIS